MSVEAKDDFPMPLDYSCPVCSAPAGSKCRNVISGLATNPHAMRGAQERAEWERLRTMDYEKEVRSDQTAKIVAALREHDHIDNTGGWWAEWIEERFDG